MIEATPLERLVQLPGGFEVTITGGGVSIFTTRISGLVTWKSERTRAERPRTRRRHGRARRSAAQAQRQLGHGQEAVVHEVALALDRLDRRHRSAPARP